MTDLSDKAIDFKGQKYVLVKDRVIAFNEEFKNGSIRTVRETEGLPTGTWVVKATVIPDLDYPDRYFTGYSQAVEGSSYINKTSALENAETSAIGRALAMMGIGVIDSIASADEINKAGSLTAKRPVGRPRKDADSAEAFEQDMNEATKYVTSRLPKDEEQAINDAVDGADGEPNYQEGVVTCDTCGKPATEKQGISKASGKPYHGIFCSTDDKSHTKWIND